ncbi:uncharacterized protein ARMOST_02356 [Armillaria ostoyae]|uniref:Uncharacterized protein n=1 Tax=Armillaria ostoyae TaxID=47428 RepID=A0A284QRP7_ARMOS|nr:uncharacterized protein ARMOST_02356 [Armillaria ostoyae]
MSSTQETPYTPELVPSSWRLFLRGAVSQYKSADSEAMSTIYRPLIPTMDSDRALSKHSKSTAVAVFMSVVLQSVGAGMAQYTAVYTFLFYVLFIHPHVSPFMILGRLQATIDETTVLFNEHRTLLVTVEQTLRELRAETYILTAGHLNAYRRVSITDVRSWIVYASKVKDTWKKTREYRKGITDLKTKIEIKLLEDAEVNEQAALRQIVHTDDMV